MSLQKWLMPALRQVSYRWPARTKVYQKARVTRGMYKCAHCSKVYNRGEIQLDHVVPVIDPTTGFVDWNTYISRLFADESGWQVLCKSCHQLKSNRENAIRRTV